MEEGAVMNGGVFLYSAINDKDLIVFTSQILTLLFWRPRPKSRWKFGYRSLTWPPKELRTGWRTCKPRRRSQTHETCTASHTNGPCAASCQPLSVSMKRDICCNSSQKKHHQKIITILRNFRNLVHNIFPICFVLSKRIKIVFI